MTDEYWECGCGYCCDTEQEAEVHLGEGHPWLSKMTDGSLAFIHVPGDTWMLADVAGGEEEGQDVS